MHRKYSLRRSELSYTPRPCRTRGLYFLVTNFDSPYARGNNFTSNQHFVHPDPGDFVGNLTEEESMFLNKT